MTSEFLRDRAAHHRRNTSHGANKIFDHSVGVGVIHIEPIEFTVRRQINARLALKIKNNPRSVDDRLLTGQSR